MFWEGKYLGEEKKTEKEKKENIWPAEEKKTEENIWRRKKFEKKNIWSIEEKKNGEGKEKQYLEKDKENNIRRRKKWCWTNGLRDRIVDSTPSVEGVK